MISQPIAPTAMPEVDEDGYCIQPKDHLWETQAKKKGEGNQLMQLEARQTSLNLHKICLLPFQMNFIQTRTVIQTTMNEIAESM